MTVIILGVLAVLLIAGGLVFAFGYVKAPPDQAFIVSGMRPHPKILIGRAGFRLPFLERKDVLELSLINIDVKTSTEVPTSDYINIAVNATVNVKIGTDNGMIERAALNFLNQDGAYISSVAQEVLEGNVREIVGQATLQELVSDRAAFAKLVLESAKLDLAAIGLEITNFNVQNFNDKEGVIKNLGVDNVETIRKQATIARAESDRDVAIAKAQASQAANEAEVTSQSEIARKQAELAETVAALKIKTDTADAQAQAAKEIEAEKQKQLRDVARTNAEIATTERQSELKMKEVELTERELEAKVKKEADATKYATEVEAQARLEASKREIEAQSYKQEEVARIKIIEAQAEKDAQILKAEALRTVAEAEAEAILAKGQAEADVILKKAEAQLAMGEASIMEMYFKVLPQVVEAAAKPLENVDSITLYGDGNNTKMVKDVIQSTDQIMSALGKTTGIDISSMLQNFVTKKQPDVIA